MDIDYATKDMILPSYDTNAIPNECPGSLADRTFGIEDVYGDIGIEVLINKNNSSKVFNNSFCVVKVFHKEY